MKKRNRKLRLNRETLRQLDVGHLQGVVGAGDTEPQWQCETGPQTGPVSACDDTLGGGGGGTIPTVPFPFTGSVYTCNNC